MNVIELKHITKSYGEGNSRVEVLRDVNLTIERGDFVAIIGQSGSGKSTLMNILGCLDTPSSGSYTVYGREAASLGPDGLAALRSEKFGFVFQRYNLLGSLDATENVAPARPCTPVWDRQNVSSAPGNFLNCLGLGERLTNRPGELSGGQQQRVSIARALMNGGDIILADEPTGALDSKSGEQVMAILMELHQAGHTIILVTHDRHIADYASRVIEIRDGEIIADTRRAPEPEDVEHSAPAFARRNRLLFMRDQLLEALRMSVQAIFAHKLRSLLTMLGIIIGIASVVTVVALGRGSQEKILADISAMGTNTIDIMPGSGFGDRRAGRVRTLTVDDSNALAQQSYIASSTPRSSSSGDLTRRNISVTAQMNGVGVQYFDVKGLSIAQGRMFNEDEVRASAAVVVIDQNTKKELFPGGENPLGEVILFKGKPLQIIGVAAEQNASFGPTENLTLWTPYTTLMNRITGARYISSITDQNPR